MPRNVPAALATHLAGGNTTVCYLLKIKPAVSGVSLFGMTTLDADVTYDDGTGDGPITYRAKSGYTPLDLVSRADLSVDNSEAHGLLAEYPSDGMTADGIAAGNYDGARFVQYLVNYNDLTTGRHVIINTGQVGQVTNLNNQTVMLEMRSLTQILKQNSIIELTSITDRAKYGDERNKMTLRWYASTVASVGVEPDRDFILGTIPGFNNAPGGASGTVTGCFFFNGDGVSKIAPLIDTAGQRVPTGFAVTDIKINGTALTLTTDYTIDAAGTVTFVTAPATGAVGTWDGTLPIYPDGYFVPGVVHWLTGANAGRENEIEEYVASTGAVTLVIPTRETIAPSDTCNIRRDSDKSKTRAIADNNLPNFRGEPELPRADGMNIQSPTPRA
jgi:uncharacterized phage protein (TIGR02218 family)